MHQTLLVTLLDDVAMSAESATAGYQESLDHLPGGALLGAAAAGGYGDRAWDLFHSGELRFGPGYPLSPSGLPTLPVPLAFHRPKLSSDHQVFNLSRDRPQGVQLEQLRRGFMDRDCNLVQVEHQASLRTALGADGRARDAFLFPLDALRAGTRFAARIWSGHQDLLDRAVQALLGEIRLGRSRNTEFGRARVELSPELDAEMDRLMETGKGNGNARIYFMSDAALRDPSTGALLLWPEAAALGLEAASPDPQYSFIRTRCYSHFNGFRQRPELERQVIRAGSVLALVGDLPADVLAGGIGEDRARGLGQVLVNPWFLEPRSLKLVPAGRQVVQQVAMPKGPVGAWLTRKLRERGLDERAYRLGREWAQELSRWGRPMRAQWGEVRTLAGRIPQTAELRTALFDSEKGYLATGVGKLRARWGASRGGETLAQAFERMFERGASDLPDPWLARAVQVAASRMARLAARDRGNRGEA